MIVASMAITHTLWKPREVRAAMFSAHQTQHLQNLQRIVDIHDNDDDARWLPKGI